MLHMLIRMRAFDKAWELLEEMYVKKKITHKALSIVLSAYARRKSFDETLEAFERVGNFVGELNTDAFNVLLKAFCSNRNMKQARAVFNKMHHRFGANRQTFNILLLGFKESGNAVAVEVFFREMQRRGFDPDIVTYNIVVDALCKKRRIDDAFELVEVIKRKGCRPNIWTYTTLIHGLGIVKNKNRACELFAELKSSGFEPDTALYNALICCFCKAGDVKWGLRSMKEMEKEGVGCDNVTYHTLLSALTNLRKEDGVCELFGRMVARDHVLTSATAIMLMKFFCSSGLHDKAFQLWDYVLRKGCCPHGHVSNLLITELCYRGKLEEAYNCFAEILGKGLHPYKQSFDILQKFYREARRENQLSQLEEKMRQLQSCLPASEEYVRDRGKEITLLEASSMDGLIA
ncbi:hypothetical protein SUGI_0892920 [Cryptomeria japonica]|nr:hypothetical protein SUGI_0892920 [Cryptomeria japonica]